MRSRRRIGCRLVLPWEIAMKNSFKIIHIFRESINELSKQMSEIQQGIMSNNRNLRTHNQINHLAKAYFSL
jgi:hypothetical protein